ncbi:MCM9 [Cordylochernes scorpioides]|uniref:DNA helicase MCM9 n=1 Tax=Cordylochernes scorpioides TaxID=51811 RepID=A0ABY6KUS3_9ARAC|nr:MCM9 [Cordylochernes scorpioides]
MTLVERCVEVSTALLSHPIEVLALIDSAVSAAAADLLAEHESRDKMEFKDHIHGRLTCLPACSEIHRTSMPHASDVGCFLSITGNLLTPPLLLPSPDEKGGGGAVTSPLKTWAQLARLIVPCTVIRTTTVKLLEKSKEYTCSQCRLGFTVQADLQQYWAVPRPSHCPNGCGQGAKLACRTEMDPSRCSDVQEVKVQEPISQLSLPRSIWVLLEDDLADSCQPGQLLTVSGVLLQRWRPLTPGTKADLELVLRAHNLEVKSRGTAAETASISEEQMEEFLSFWRSHQAAPLSGRDAILSNLCPQVYGLYLVKLAIALVMAGGVQYVDQSGTRVRGEPHLLLVGDPGTGKSQFLKYVARVSPRSVLTTGTGSTSAGLTVSAVRDSGEWQLEAGALVLSDGGICCIDEFNSIKEADRVTIHEAMEQQTISVAKAGLVCKLNSRCSILAAANPTGRYDPSQPLCVNVALASPLLSRFDLVLVLLDCPNPSWDQLVAGFLLGTSHPGGIHHFVCFLFPCSKCVLELKLYLGIKRYSHRPHVPGQAGQWSLDKMRDYFSAIKTLRPQLTPDCIRVLQGYYRFQRSADNRSMARTTIRLLESLVRLAQAHARLMFRQEVVVQDAIFAVLLVERSMHNSAIFPSSINSLHAGFPRDPDGEYLRVRDAILKHIGISDLGESGAPPPPSKPPGQNSPFFSHQGLEKQSEQPGDSVKSNKQQDPGTSAPPLQTESFLGDGTRESSSLHSDLGLTEQKSIVCAGSSDKLTTAASCGNLPQTAAHMFDVTRDDLFTSAPSASSQPPESNTVHSSRAGSTSQSRKKSMFRVPSSDLFETSMSEDSPQSGLTPPLTTHKPSSQVPAKSQPVLSQSKIFKVRSTDLFNDDFDDTIVLNTTDLSTTKEDVPPGIAQLINSFAFSRDKPAAKSHFTQLRPQQNPKVSREQECSTLLKANNSHQENPWSWLDSEQSSFTGLRDSRNSPQVHSETSPSTSSNKIPNGGLQVAASKLNKFAFVPRTDSAQDKPSKRIFSLDPNDLDLEDILKKPRRS